MKNSNETIDNSTHDLPPCRAVPQSTALPRVLRAIFLHFFAIQQAVSRLHDFCTCLLSTLFHGTECTLSHI
jgi:hypothetical protein